jgi:alkylated DNA repair protein (DNA oxidative demethylase)
MDFPKARQGAIALLAAIREVVAGAPLFTPTMPRSGTPMSVRMTNCGPLGWVTDKERGYRYQATHPETGKPWPPIPPLLLDLWDGVADYPFPPQACLVNYYTGSAKMGLHQDKTRRISRLPSFPCRWRHADSLGGRSRGAPRNSS